MTMNTSSCPPPGTPSQLRRWLFAGAGVACVGVGAVGVFVPGLPTTVFLLMASWLFARSCPWLEDRLVRIPLFRPFLARVEPGAGMPRHAVRGTLAVMWAAIGVSAGLLLLGQRPGRLVAAAIVLAGLLGTVVILRLGRRGRSANRPAPLEPPRHQSAVEQTVAPRCPLRLSDSISADLVGSAADPSNPG